MSGYIGAPPVPQATQNRETFTATSNQTTFATLGYTAGFVDVYLNGVKLAPADFTATNGSDVVLASGAAASDILEVVAYEPFNILDPTFKSDTTFQGDNYNLVWDKSDNALEFGDNAKAVFGAGSDLQIHHDGSHSYIEDAGTGELRLRGNASVKINQFNNNEAMAIFNVNGSVDLRYDNVTKLETTSSGIDVTGTLVSDGLTVSGDAVFTPDNDGVRITGANYATLRLEENDTTDLNTTIFNSSGAFSIYTSNDARSSLTQRLDIDHSTGDISFYEDTGSTAKLHWSASAESLVVGASSTPTVFEATGSKNDQWAGKFTNTNSGGYGVLAITAGSTENEKAFEVRKNTSDTAMLINGLGNVGIGATSPGFPLSVEVDNNTWVSRIYNTGSDADASGLLVRTDATSAHNALAFGVYADSGYKMVVRSTGNVGIGDSNPPSTVKLAIQADGIGIRLDGTANTTRSLFFRNTTTTNPAEIIADGSLRIRTEDASTAITFHTNSSGSNNERVRIDSAGLVGIGKVPASSTGSMLQVEGADGIAMRRSGQTNHFVLRPLTSSDGDGIRFTQEGVGDRMVIDSSGNIIAKTGEVQVSPASGTSKLRLTSQGSGSKVFSVCGQIPGVSNTGFAIRNETDSRNDLLIDGSGNVGIGGTPDVPLLIGKTASDHTSAAVTIKNLQTGGYGSILNFESTNTSGSAITAASIGTEGAENYSSTDTTSSHLKFSTVGDGVLAERMRIDAFGRVGIGTSSMSSFYATKFVVNVGDEDGITIYNDGANERAYIMFADATSGTGRYSGQISYDHNNDQMSFTTAANTRMTIDGSGGTGGNVNILGGDLVIGTAGNGIDFSAQTATSASGASTGSELLDHYEEGTFTPTYVGTSSSITVTLDSQVGFYTRIGDTVFFRIHLGSDAVSGGSSSNLQINGLPFATNSGRNFSGPVGLNYSWGSNNPYFWYSDANASVMLLYKEGGANLTTNDLATGTNSNRIWIQGQYKV